MATKDIRSSIPKTNYTIGRNHKVDQITFHHIVGDAPSALARFRKPNEQVSSTYVISAAGTVYYVVDEKNTPYTDGNFASNSRAITIEHAGPPYAEKMYQASIKLCKEIRSRHNITRFKRHRDIIATACPGGLNVERIVKESGKGDDMYKDHNAKYWYDKYAKAQKERTTYRTRLVNVLNTITGIVKNRGK